MEEAGKRPRCMNAGCGAAESGGGEWRKGWGLRSGGLVTLCGKCGTAYEQSYFCDIFHAKESGWRQCASCGKRLHCGCIVSKASVCLLDHGGVQCIVCSKKLEISPVLSGAIQDVLPQNSSSVVDLSDESIKDEKLNETGVSVVGSGCELQPSSPDAKMDSNSAKKVDNTQVEKYIDVKAHSSVFPVQKVSLDDSVAGSFGIIGPDQTALPLCDTRSMSFSIRNPPRVASLISPKEDYRDVTTDKIMSKPLNPACLSIGLGSSSPKNVIETGFNVGFPRTALVSNSIVMEIRDENKGQSNFQSWQRTQNLLSMPTKTSHAVASEASKNILPNLRVARPPAEGRGRNQLLPRYWPRITDQELRQISGDSNATIVPLFEKVLSASDAGRIGRLVLPKACAEAYFPPISQPEGLPLKIQDINGKDWHFQFRFWPNNNSRMYVLEGVTPCIQSLQLQAGDTVTFSRIDPEGKLVMGFRKATNSQDSPISATTNAALGNETFFTAVGETVSVVSNYSGLLQSVRGAEDLNMSCMSEYLNSADGDMSWSKTDKYSARSNEAFTLQPLLLSDKKQSCSLGTKSKRLHMDSEDALELRLTWEEAQDLLRPPPSSKPSVVVIEDQEFEEYEEPPIFAKRTIFTERSSGGQDQWIQCDDCFKWRQLPVDILPPSKWTCADNRWDPKRSSCAMLEELSPIELQYILQQDMEIRRQKINAYLKQSHLEQESCGLDALVTATALGDAGSPSMPSVATTTKHPRHRPGCSCIVCIQPPSGKGPKHDPSCVCNVCMTVKRRFKTLMMRKRKRQSEIDEAEAVQRKVLWGHREEAEDSGGTRNSAPVDMQRDGDSGTLDLNCQPGRDETNLRDAGPLVTRPASMMSLLQVASRPLEAYLKQNGLTSLAALEQQQQPSSSSFTMPQAAVGGATASDNEARTPEERDREGGAADDEHSVG